MSKKSERKRIRQSRKYQELRRKRDSWIGMADDQMAAFGRIKRGTITWFNRREAMFGRSPTTGSDGG